MDIGVAATLRDVFLPPADVRRVVRVREHGGETRVVVTHGYEHGWGGGDLAISEWLAARMQSIEGPPWLDAVARDLSSVRSAFARAFGHLEDEASGPCCNVTCLSLSGGIADAAWLSRYTLFHVRDRALIAETRPHSLVRELRMAGRIRDDELAAFAQSNPSTGGVFTGTVEALTRLARPWPTSVGDHLVIANVGPSDAAREGLLNLLDRNVGKAAQELVQLDPDYLNIAVVIRL